jgi:hypothetical protein
MVENDPMPTKSTAIEFKSIDQRERNLS